jgi:hypothetical protein
VHLTWVEQTKGLQVFGHQYSHDGGITWIQPAGVATNVDVFSRPSLTEDAGDVLHLLQILKETNLELRLVHRSWTGERWIANEGFTLSEAIDFSDSVVSAAISPQGSLGMIFTGNALDDMVEFTAHELLFADRMYEVGEALPEAPPLPSAPTAIPTPTVMPTLEPTQTPVVIPLAAAPSQFGMIPVDNTFSGLIVAAALAIIVVALAFGLYLVISRVRGH